VWEKKKNTTSAPFSFSHERGFVVVISDISFWSGLGKSHFARSVFFSFLRFALFALFPIGKSGSGFPD
jgi:hypothetical protein